MTAPTPPAEFWTRLLTVVDEVKPRWKRTDARNEAFCSTATGVVKIWLFDTAHGDPFRVDLLDGSADPLASLEVPVAHKLRPLIVACWDEAQSQSAANDVAALARATDVADEMIRDLIDAERLGGGDRG